MGPVSSHSQLEQDLNYIDIGQGEGATLSVGGDRVRRDTEGSDSDTRRRAASELVKSLTERFPAQVGGS